MPSDSIFFTEVQPPFLHDEDFIKTVMQDMHSNDLGFCSLEALVKFPGAVIPRCARECPSELRHWAELLSFDVWDNEDNVKAWFTNGGPFVEECFPEEWRFRPKIFLLIAKYCPYEYIKCIRSFTCASSHLRTNKSFMMEVINYNPALYQVACSELRQDFNVRILVCSRGNDLMDIRQFGMTASGAIETFKAAKEKYIADKGFREYCYCVTQASPELPVARMNSDPETSAALSSLVAEYLDILTGKEIHRVRKCMKLLLTIEL